MELKELLKLPKLKLGGFKCVKCSERFYSEIEELKGMLEIKKLKYDKAMMSKQDKNAAEERIKKLEFHLGADSTIIEDQIKNQEIGIERVNNNEHTWKWHTKSYYCETCGFTFDRGNQV